MPVINLSSDHMAILANPLFQALIASGEASFDVESKLIKIQQYPLIEAEDLVEFRAQLHDLHVLIEQHERSQELLQNITYYKLLFFTEYKYLFTYGVLTLEEILSLDFKQMASIGRLENLICEGLDVEQERKTESLSTKEQVAARIHDMVKKKLISKEDQFNFPVITYASPSFCALIINGKISLKNIQLLISQKKINLIGYNMYCLVMADIISIKQVMRLTQNKLFQIERLNLREIKVDPIVDQTLARIVQEEVIRYLKNTKPPQTSRSFIFFNQTMKNMEHTHITKELWLKIKEDVSTRMWNTFHFLFSSHDDPNFVAKIEAGQDVKLTPSSEIQGHLADSEGYREYCRHTMFSSRLLQTSTDINAVFNETTKKSLI